MAIATRTDKRTNDRKRQRIPCEIHADDRRHSGIVLDVSPTGLFVQTTALFPPGTRLRIVLKQTPYSPSLTLDAVVARGKRVPPQLASAASGGIGLRVLDPKPDYQALSADLSARPAPALAPPSPPAGPTAPRGPVFLVRLARSEGNRSRVLEVVAEDDHAARRVALSQLGAGWDVQAVTKR